MIKVYDGISIYIYIYTIYICMSVCVYFTDPFAEVWFDRRVILSGGLNSEFSFSSTGCQNKANERCLPYDLHKTGERIIGFLPYSRVFMSSEMQPVSTRNWTRVVVSISYDDNHCTSNARAHTHKHTQTHTHTHIYIYIYISWLHSKQVPNCIRIE